jgi:subfamily B ATP-binding cassette protein MsbA
VTETFGGIRVIKAYALDRDEQATFEQGNRRLLEAALAALRSQALTGAAMYALMGLSACLILGVGTSRIASGRMTLGEFTTVLALVASALPSLAQVISFGSQAGEALAGMNRVQDLLELEPEQPRAVSLCFAPVLRGEVVFDRVCFSYVHGCPVLSDISFAVPTGSVAAIVGRSGAGKSTVANLLLHFYTPSSGRILVDGLDLSEVRLDSYRAQLGLVLQETFLFDGTIAENVSIARREASRQEVLDACRTASVDEFAERLDRGYETLVGERGVKLSGGQRQRIALARAILADPRILILDEATSNLDSESEALVREALTRVMRGRTVFVIAHRLSTIREADQVLVLEGGRVVERGDHNSLVRSRGRYQELFASEAL